MDTGPDEGLARARDRWLLRHLEQWGPLTARALADTRMLDGPTVARRLAPPPREGRGGLAGYDARGEPRYDVGAVG